MAAFKINSDGSLTSVTGSPFRIDGSPTVVKGDPQGRFVFIGERHITPGTRGADCSDEPSVLLTERIDPASGKLTQIDQNMLRGSCVRDIAIDPSGTHLYVAARNITTTGGAIQSFQISPGGMLTELPGSPLLVEDLPTSMAMHPSGRFLFAATPDLSVLDRDSTTGALSLRGVSGTPKRQLALNSDGNLLIASERDTGEISQFVVDSNGNISTALAGSQRASIAGRLVVDPQGQFSVLTEISADADSGGLSTLRLEQPNGGYLKMKLAPSGSEPALAGLAFDPAGRFVYAISARDGTVSGYALDRNTGGLSAIGKTSAAGGTAVSITIVQPR